MPVRDRARDDTEVLLEAQRTRAVNVRGDRENRIQGAFAGVFSGLGFVTGGANPRFVLNVNVVNRPTDHGVPGVVFTQLELSANLTDTASAPCRCIGLKVGKNR